MSTLLPAAGRGGIPPLRRALERVRRKTLRPLGANPPVRVPIGQCEELFATLFRRCCSRIDAYAFLINTSKAVEPLSISVSEVA